MLPRRLRAKSSQAFVAETQVLQLFLRVEAGGVLALASMLDRCFFASHLARTSPHLRVGVSALEGPRR